MKNVDPNHLERCTKACCCTWKHNGSIPTSTSSKWKQSWYCTKNDMIYVYSNLVRSSQLEYLLLQSRTRSTASSSPWTLLYSALTGTRTQSTVTALSAGTTARPVREPAATQQHVSTRAQQVQEQAPAEAAHARPGAWRDLRRRLDLVSRQSRSMPLPLTSLPTVAVLTFSRHVECSTRCRLPMRCHRLLPRAQAKGRRYGPSLRARTASPPTWRAPPSDVSSGPTALRPSPPFKPSASASPQQIPPSPPAPTVIFSLSLSLSQLSIQAKRARIPA